MLSGLLVGVRRARVTVSYAVIVATVTAVMVRMDPAVHDALIRHASTNLHNLSRGRVGTLVGSAFVVDAGSIGVWLPGLVCLLLAAELTCGGRRLVLTFVIGHVGATLLVAAGLATAVRLDWLSASIARAPDVGMSYGAMAVVGALTGALPPRRRPAWLGFWFAAAAVVIAGGAGFTDVGHVVALTLGVLVSARVGVRPRWSVPRVILLALGASFGFLVLADGMVSVVYGLAWGALGALTAAGFDRLRSADASDKRVGRRFIQTRRPTLHTNASADAVIQSERHDCGGSSRSSPGASQS